MSTSPETVLTPSLLEELKRRWADTGMPIVSNLRPGLTDADIDDLTAGLGVDLSVEARTWWRWHDGATPAGGLGASTQLGSLAFDYRPLAHAVELYRSARQFAGDSASAPGMPEESAHEDYWWAKEWFPLFENGHGGLVACDCSASLDGPTPILNVTWEDGGPFDRPRAKSLGQMVSWWIEAFDDGTWSYDAGSQRWHRDYERLDAARRTSGLL